jgi:hypothetical protein
MPQSRVRLRYHKVPWPSSKDLGSIQGRVRTMYNASMPTQPTRSAISDASVQMDWEAGGMIIQQQGGLSDLLNTVHLFVE